MEVLDSMPWTAKNSVFRKLAEIAEVSNMSKEERIKYDSSLRYYRDTISVLQGAVDEGRKEGREEGRKEGQEEANLNNAKVMKSLGLPVDTIQKVTGLDVERIKSLLINN